MMELLDLNFGAQADNPFGLVGVHFHRLEPCTFVAFTPKSEEFQEALTAADLHVQAFLQSTLKQYSALSKLDWISVTVPGFETTPGVLRRGSPALFPLQIELEI